MTTKEIEHIAYKTLWKKGTYLVYECAVPRSYQNKYHRERVDLVSYETTGIFRFYEIKNSVSDFHSSAALTFLGHYNYFIMPKSLYDKVKEEIPNHIGVWVVYEFSSRRYMECIKKPKKQELKVNSDDMKFAILQALSREYKKYRKILEEKSKDKKDKGNKGKRK